MRIPRATRLKYLGGFRVLVGFSDGVEGEADLRHHFAIRKGLLGELADEAAFATLHLNKEAGVLAWRNGVAFDPYYSGPRSAAGPFPPERPARHSLLITHEHHEVRLHRRVPLTQPGRSGPAASFADSPPFIWQPTVHMW